MKEPILSREQVLKIVRKTLKENNDRDKLSSDRFVVLAAALESAVLEKLCGELIYQIAFSDEDGWCDTHKKCYDDHPKHMRRIVYDLDRSKS